MLDHPTLDHLKALRLDGMAEAFAELQAQDFGNGSVLVKAFITRLQSPHKQEFCFPTCPLPFFTPARN